MTDQLAQQIVFPSGTVTGPLQGNPSSLGDLFKLTGVNGPGNLLNVIIFLAGAVLLIYIIIGGFKYLTAQGDPKAMDAARNTITYALIGFGIIAFSYLIFQIAELFFGFKILGFNEMVPAAYAQSPVSIGDTKVGSSDLKTLFPSVGAVIGRVLKFAIPLAGIGFLVFLTIGGLKWVSSQGDKAAVQSARGTITTAIVGLTIVVASFIVLQAIELITGFGVGTK